MIVLKTPVLAPHWRSVTHLHDSQSRGLITAPFLSSCPPGLLGATCHPLPGCHSLQWRCKGPLLTVLTHILPHTSFHAPCLPSPSLFPSITTCPSCPSGLGYLNPTLSWCLPSSLCPVLISGQWATLKVSPRTFFYWVIVDVQYTLQNCDSQLLKVTLYYGLPW